MDYAQVTTIENVPMVPVHSGAPYSCANAAAVLVATWYKLDESQVRAVALSIGGDAKGTTLGTIADALRSQGVEAEVASLELRDLPELRYAAILFLDPPAPDALGHVLVVLPSEQGPVLVDPSADSGRQFPKWETITRRWRGVAVVTSRDQPRSHWTSWPLVLATLVGLGGGVAIRLGLRRRSSASLG